MKIPRDLSGEDLVRLLCRRWNYRIVHQVGSHVVLETETPSHQRIAVPAHKNLRLGTLNSILKGLLIHRETKPAFQNVLKKFLDSLFGTNLGGKSVGVRRVLHAHI